MNKYVVLKEKELKNGVYDQEEACFFDTEEEANEKAADMSIDIREADRKGYIVSVGIVDENDLEESGNWETFNQVEILSIFETEE